jgi:hypothetical protein
MHSARGSYSSPHFLLGNEGDADRSWGDGSGFFEELVADPAGGGVEQYDVQVAGGEGGANSTLVRSYCH